MALPLLLLFALGTVQLTLLQQARLLMEYAAFSAVRVGVVSNGSLERMRGAALFATLPLYGRTDSPQVVAATRLTQRELDEAFRRLLLPAEVEGVPTAGLVQVDTLNPRHSLELELAASPQGGGTWQELDLDGQGTFAEGEVKPDPLRDGALAAATLLRVRVQAFYELKIPLANAVFHWAWRKAHAQGSDSMSGQEGALLAGLADGTRSLDLSGRRRFFLPLNAEYRMRMQSNFFRKWVVH